MQIRKSIVNIPLLAGMILSIAVHVAALYSRGTYTPAEPQLESGETVVQLTLLPSRASQAALPEPAPPEPRIIPPVPVEPIPVPSPEPVIEALPEPATEPMPEPPKEVTPEPALPEVTEAAEINSVEQDASLIKDKGVITGAVAASPVSPVYPRTARRRGEEGEVMLSIEVLASGRAGKIEIVGSSGYKSLDDAAVKAVKNAPFTPAMQFGRAIDSVTELAITFELKND